MRKKKCSKSKIKNKEGKRTLMQKERKNKEKKRGI